MEFANHIVETLESQELVETKKSSKFIDECFVFVIRLIAIAAVSLATLSTLAIGF